MAKKDEILDKKRQQSFLCAPSYKREIDEMGNKGLKRTIFTLIDFIIFRHTIPIDFITKVTMKNGS